MNVNRMVTALLIGVIFIFISKIAFSNGINPPRTTRVILAEYTKENDSKTHELYRVLVKSGISTFKSLLTFQIGGSHENIPLGEIQKIIILSSKPNDNGFVKVQLFLFDDEEAQPSMLLVKEGDNFLKLSGYKNNGDWSSIALTKCKEINFSYKSIDNSDSGRPRGPAW